jgi:hypothetical protein
METNKAKGSADTDKATLAVYQLADEVKDLNKSIVDIVNTVNHLSGRISKFDEHLSEINTDPPPFDMKRVEVVMSKGLTDMSVQITSEIKKTRRTYQLLLFPPQDAKLFYKIVFGRWALYFAICLGILKVYDWAVHESDNRAQIEIEEVKFRNERINRAWYYMYSLKNKSLHRQMDSALVKSAR